MNMKDIGASPAMTPEAGGYSEGMTLRQYYAGQAMAGLVGTGSELAVAKASVEYADAIFDELSNPNGSQKE